jgi:hypothetical protein
MDCGSILSLLLVTSNATLNENMLSTTILFISNISHVLIWFIEISLFSCTCSGLGGNSSGNSSSRGSASGDSVSG